MMNEYFLMMKSELLLTVIIFIILFLKITSKDQSDEITVDNSSFLNIANILLVINCAVCLFGNVGGTLFGDMFRNNSLLTLEKCILSFGTLLVSLTAYDWLKTHKHVYEFYMLLLSTLLGMFFMISSDNLLMFYVGLELSTIPLAALANFDLDKKRSSEAAMKMIMMSAFASGILLMGISLVYGSTGTLSLKLLPGLLYNNPLQLFAMILLIAGFGFKISAVPFHLWTADVYEGSPSAVTAYLSVVSKGAILFVMTTVMFNAFQPLAAEWYHVLFILAIATMVIGNIFALRQKNLKRLLAFSSIAQVGFILVGMSGQSAASETSIVYFILIYMFSNLGAFGVITLVSARTGKEELSDYAGFYKSNPLLTWVLALSLFSLAGVPPAAGFFGKFFLLMAGAAKGNYLLIIIAALNMVISMYYYLVVVKVMFTGKNDHPVENIKPGIIPLSGLIVCVIGVLLSGLHGEVYNFIRYIVG